ncbi:MAG: hypothetical protein ABJA82_06355 [Myxococcales bacterium]
MHGRIIANLYGKHRGPQVHPEPVEPPPLPVVNPLLKKSIPYRLQVETVMKRSDLPALSRGGQQLVNLIQSTQTLRLVHASMEVNNDEVRLFHYWNMGYDADALTMAELQLPDMPGYARFEKLIVDEIKDIVIPTARARRDPSAELDLAARYVYFRAAYKVTTENLSEFQARLEASVIPFAISNGWFLGDSFLGITGLAGKIVQFWIVPENAVALAPARLAAAPWQDLLREAPTYKFLEALPADPFLGDRTSKPTEIAIPIRQAKSDKKKNGSAGTHSKTTQPGGLSHAK